jgi:hypothetical protein
MIRDIGTVVERYSFVTLNGVGLVGAVPRGSILSVSVHDWSSIVCGVIFAAVFDSHAYPFENVAVVPMSSTTRRSPVNGHRITSRVARTTITLGSLVVPVDSRSGHLRNWFAVRTSVTENECESGPVKGKVAAVCVAGAVGPVGGDIVNVSVPEVSVALEIV